MAEARPRNRFMPWFVGLMVIVACDAYVAYRMYAADCPAPTAVEAIVVVVIPLVYLALAYLTFKSQP
jgi:hypothetical protein